MNSTVRAGLIVLLVAFAVLLLAGVAIAAPIAFVGALTTAAGLAHPDAPDAEPGEVGPRWRR